VSQLLKKKVECDFSSAFELKGARDGPFITWQFYPQLVLRGVSRQLFDISKLVIFNLELFYSLAGGTPYVISTENLSVVYPSPIRLFWQ
jgi:hypothetical protein